MSPLVDGEQRVGNEALPTLRAQKLGLSFACCISMIFFKVCLGIGVLLNTSSAAFGAAIAVLHSWCYSCFPFQLFIGLLQWILEED